MRAARLHADGEPLQIDEVDAPEPGSGEVLSRIASSGACHCDLHVMDGDLPILSWMVPGSTVVAIGIGRLGLAMARDGQITGDVEQHPLEDINVVFERLERGEIAGRAVLNP